MIYISMMYSQHFIDFSVVTTESNESAVHQFEFEIRVDGEAGVRPEGT